MNILEKQSYKWWQTKFVVCFIIICIITLIHIVGVIELGRIILIGSNFIKPFKVCILCYEIEIEHMYFVIHSRINGFFIEHSD